MPLDDHGIYRYTDADLASPVPDLLNLLGGSISGVVARTTGVITYNEGWRAPTAGSLVPRPVSMTKRDGRVTFEGGGVENSSVCSLAQYGQVVAPITIPVGYRPGSPVRIPAFVTVSGVFAAAGALLIKLDGSTVLQTTTAWSSVPAGSGLFEIAGASWKAVS